MQERPKPKRRARRRPVSQAQFERYIKENERALLAACKKFNRSGWGRGVAPHPDDTKSRRFNRLQKAFEELEDMLMTESSGSVRARLQAAQTTFSVIARLRPKGENLGLPNIAWAARAHFGLMMISLKRGNLKVAVLHMLLAFDACPLETAENLLPHAYKSLLFAHCKDVTAALRASERALPLHYRRADEIRRKILWTKAKRIGGGAFGAAAALVSELRHLAHAIHTASHYLAEKREEIDKLEAELANLPTRSVVEEAFRVAFTERLREVVRPLLEMQENSGLHRIKARSSNVAPNKRLHRPRSTRR